jgi:hypothetical protein
MTEHLPPIIITRRDHARLERLAANAMKRGHPISRLLISEIRRADACDANKISCRVARLNGWMTYGIDGSKQTPSTILVCPNVIQRRSGNSIGAFALGRRRSRNECQELHSMLQRQGRARLRHCREHRRSGASALAVSAQGALRAKCDPHGSSRAR